MYKITTTSNNEALNEDIRLLLGCIPEDSLMGFLLQYTRMHEIAIKVYEGHTTELKVETYKDGCINVKFIKDYQKDLFTCPELMPPSLKEVVEKYLDGDLDYVSLGKFKDECLALGFTFEYYLDAVPYALRSVEVELEWIEY